MLLYYLPQQLTFVQVPDQNNELDSLLKKEKEKHYSTKELVGLAAEKIADILVRFMDNNIKK